MNHLFIISRLEAQEFGKHYNQKPDRKKARKRENILELRTIPGLSLPHTYLLHFMAFSPVPIWTG